MPSDTLFLHEHLNSATVTQILHDFQNKLAPCPREKKSLKHIHQTRTVGKEKQLIHFFLQLKKC